MIIRNHKDEFPVGKRTLYNYVEKGYLDIINLDLPRKVRYKKRVKKQEVTTKDTKIRNGRTYSNFKDYIKYYNNNNFNINIVEMDTVEGIKGESVLLSLLWRSSNFMLAYKLENKDSESVSNFFINLKNLLGYEKFHILFPTCKLIKRISYGFRNFKNMKSRILIITNVFRKEKRKYYTKYSTPKYV